MASDDSSISDPSRANREAVPIIRQESSNSDTTLFGEDGWTLPGPTELREELERRYSDSEKAEAWARSAELVKTYNDELVQRWKEEMDTLLVYAGLFSAVLTAFNVQSYQLLQPAPTDPTLAVLQRISAQLTSFSVNPSFINSTQPALSEEDINPPFSPPISAVWINTLWFSSLVCSLASASIALMVKQWLHELSVGVSGTSRESARIRQYRLNSLKRWRVGGIVIIIPILLQLGLVLFLAGLVLLLWTLHVTVASVASGLVGILFIFLGVTTVLPVLKVNCCYRSPQAVGIFIFLRAIRRTIQGTMIGLAESAWNLTKSWRRCGGVLGELAVLSWRIYVAQCVSKKNFPTWHGREQLVVAQVTSTLDRDLAATAYVAALDTHSLDNTRMLLTDLPWRDAAACYDDIFSVRARIWGNKASRVEDKFPQHTYEMLQIMLAATPEERDQGWQDAVTTLLGRLPPHKEGSFDKDGLRLMCILAMDNNLPADTAFLRVVMHMRDQEALRTELNSGMRAVMLVAEWRMRNPGGSDSSTTLRHYLQSIELIIHCALRQQSPALSVDERATVRMRAQTALTSFRDFLRTSLWREPSLYICLGLSNIVPLLVELVQRDREWVTEDLVEVLDSVWSAVQEEELIAADRNRLRRLHAYIEWTGEVLEVLKAVISGRPIDSSRKVVFDRPTLQPEPQRTRRFSVRSISRSSSRSRVTIF
ncbi:hypothetical protein C8Q78DRAFT_661106 [Trametes maxima]|nr:hypothetical protein C8Q78DRAFT_661106 [Trametes maxima]